jgi:uncharacterized phage protein (TIGR01671 family)
MRTIKFRAWLPKLEGQKAYYNDKGEIEKMHYNLDSRGSVGLSYSQRDGSFDHPSPIVMQYTGLHDKSGKEIYEGDIVRKEYIVQKVDQSRVGVIKWFSENEGHDYSGWGHTHQWTGESLQDTEIIGNIYENSNLLKE